MTVLRFNPLVFGKRIGFGKWIAGTAGTAIFAIVSSADGVQAATFTANITGDQVVPGTPSTAVGTGTFTLNEDKTELAYTLSFEGVNLKADNRTAPSDVNKIHIHAAPTGNNGPHTLNIFGLPAEDDQDLTVDYAANTLSGIWDDSDISDLNGNGIADPNDSKQLSQFTDALKSGGLYVQVHTNRFDSSSGFPGELRGQILSADNSPTAQTPEPFSVFGMVIAAGIAGASLRKRTSV